MLKPLLENFLKPMLSSITVLLRRWAYNFDGVDDRGQLQFRAINPDGDIDIEFRTGPTLPPTGCCIVDQSLSNNFTLKELYLQINAGGSLQLVIGGSYLASNTNVIVAPNTMYRVQLVGTTLRYFRNGIQTQQATVTRGTNREPTAVTKLGAWSSGAGFEGFYLGQLYDVRINGTLYPIADRNQSIQLPQPSGLGPELITQTVLENPASKGSQWTYLGGGRWQYVGDGQGSLQFITTANLPEAGFIEYEVESYERISGAGGMRISPTSTNFFGDRLFSATGIKRVYYTQKPAAIVFTRNSSGDVINCVIKNISFKPLWVANATELSANRPAGNYINAGEISIAGGGTTELMTADVAVESSTYYQVLPVGGAPDRSRWQWRRASDNQWQYGAANINYSTVDGAAQGLLLTPANCNAVRIYYKSAAATATGLSIRKLDSLCNPMNLVNTNPDRWQEIAQ